MMKKMFFTVVLGSFFFLSSAMAQKNEENQIHVRQQLRSILRVHTDSEYPGQC